MVRGSHIYQRCYCKKYECKGFSGESIELSEKGIIKLGLGKRGLPPGFNFNFSSGKVGKQCVINA